MLDRGGGIVVRAAEAAQALHHAAAAGDAHGFQTFAKSAARLSAIPVPSQSSSAAPPMF